MTYRLQDLMFIIVAMVNKKSCRGYGLKCEE